MRCSRRSTRASALVAASASALLLVAAPFARADKPPPVDCEALRCAVQPTIDTMCPCDTATNHGQYVKCVNGALKTLGVPPQCRGAVTSCAARSVCGKADAVICDLPEFGKCDRRTGTCADTGSACGSFVDCPDGTKCAHARSAAACVAKGGTVRGTPSCCECGGVTTTTVPSTSTSSTTTVPTTSTTSSTVVTTTSTSSSTAETVTTSSTSSSSTSTSSTSTSTSSSTSTTLGSPSGAFV